MKWKIGLLIVVLAGGIIFVSGSMYIVRPDQFAIVTEFGKPTRVVAKTGGCLQPAELVGLREEEIPAGKTCDVFEAEPDPGLYFKTPFVEDVRFIDSRVRGWKESAFETKTRELRTIDFVAFARWRVVDPLRFYTSTAASAGTPETAEANAMGHMDSVVTANVQAIVREKKLASIVRDDSREFEARAQLDLTQLIAAYGECRPENNPQIVEVLEEARRSTEQGANVEKAPAERSEIVDAIRQKANPILESQFGITVLDLHFKRLNYSPAIHREMVAQIAADRNRDIQMYEKVKNVCLGAIDLVRATRKGEIDGERDRELRRVAGEAKAQAIAIKAAAFNDSPDFFRFVKTLELYEQGLGPGTRMILSADSPIFYLMQDPKLLEVAKQRDLPAPPPLGSDVMPPTPGGDDGGQGMPPTPGGDDGGQGMPPTPGEAPAPEDGAPTTP